MFVSDEESSIFCEEENVKLLNKLHDKLLLKPPFKVKFKFFHIFLYSADNVSIKNAFD